MDLVKLRNRVTQLASPKGRKIYLYGDYLVRVAATDTTGEQWGANVRFVSCDFDLGGINVILGYL